MAMVIMNGMVTLIRIMIAKITMKTMAMTTLKSKKNVTLMIIRTKVKTMMERR